MEDGDAQGRPAGPPLAAGLKLDSPEVMPGGTVTVGRSTVLCVLADPRGRLPCSF